MMVILNYLRLLLVVAGNISNFLAKVIKIAKNLFINNCKFYF